jgi:hypothetical protein
LPFKNQTRSSASPFFPLSSPSSLSTLTRCRTGCARARFARQGRSGTKRPPLSSVKPGRALVHARRRCSVTGAPPQLRDRVAAAARSKSERRPPVVPSIRRPGALPEQAAPTASSARTSQHRRLSPTPEHRWPRECPRCCCPFASGTEPEASSKSGHSGSSPSLVSTHLRPPRSPLSILLTPEFLSRWIARIFGRPGTFCPPAMVSRKRSSPLRRRDKVAVFLLAP